MVSAGSNAAAANVNAVFVKADTDENVHGVRDRSDTGRGTRRELRRYSPAPAVADSAAPDSAGADPVPGVTGPRRSGAVDCGDTESMKLSRPVSWFLLAFGVWSWVIWVTFVKNLWQDASGLAFDDAGDPTAYFWVHLLLAVTSLLLGTAVGVIGLRGVRALRRDRE